MMYQKFSRTVYSTLVFFGISFLALSLIPLLYLLEEESRKIPGVIVALIFWLFLILGFVSIPRAGNHAFQVRRKLAARGKRIARKRVGILNFSREKSHLAVYGVILVGLLLLFIDLLAGDVFGDWAFPILSGTLFAIALHGVIDGRNYRTLQLYNTLLEEENEKDE